MAALFVTLKMWKHPNVRQWMNGSTELNIQTMEYYLATKRNKVMTYATTQMKLKSMLSESGLFQKITYYMIAFL